MCRCFQPRKAGDFPHTLFPAAMAKKGKKGHAAAARAKEKAAETAAPVGDARKGVKGHLVAK